MGNIQKKGETLKMKSYITEFEYEGKKYTLIDRREQRRQVEMLCKFHRIVFTIASVVAMFAFLFMLGTVGHSDMVDEYHLVDTWSTKQYVISLGLNLVIFALGIKIANESNKEVIACKRWIRRHFSEDNERYYS